MYKKLIWPSLVFLSIALSLVFVVGFVIAIQISQGNETRSSDNINQSISDDKELDIIDRDQVMLKSDHLKDILIMGDSIGFGFGDDNNLGLGNRYKALVDPENNQDIQVTNISVSGDEVLDLERLISQKEYEEIIIKANLIIISIGGNDLNRLQYDDSLTLEAQYNEVLAMYKNKLQLIIDKLRILNNDAQLVLIGLYDPYQDEETSKTRLLLNWNYETRLIVNENFKMMYIPTYELFQYNLESYLAFDKFHPSAKGYESIANEMYILLNGGLN